MSVPYNKCVEPKSSGRHAFRLRESRAGTAQVILLPQADIAPAYSAHARVIRTRVHSPRGAELNINGKIFKSVSNTDNGEVSTETTFHYYEENGVVWAEYAGGSIIRGNMVGRWEASNALDLRYQHVNRDGRIKTGICQSVVLIDKTDRFRIKERWKWTCEDFSEGESEMVEIKD